MWPRDRSRPMPAQQVIGTCRGGRISTRTDGGRLRTPEVWDAISLSGLSPETTSPDRPSSTRPPQPLSALL